MLVVAGFLAAPFVAAMVVEVGPDFVVGPDTALARVADNRPDFVAWHCYRATAEVLDPAVVARN